MPLGILPSWIQGEPSQFSDAYAHGAQQGLALAEMRDKIAARNHERQIQLEEMQSREQERAAAAAERAKEFDARQGLSREEMASHEKLAGIQQGALKDYRDAQLDLHKAGLTLREKLGQPKALSDQAVPIYLPDGTIAGYGADTGPSTRHFIADKNALAKEGALSKVQEQEISVVREKQQELRKKIDKESDPDLQIGLYNRLLNLNRQRDAIIHPPPTALPVNPSVAPMAPPAPAGPLGTMPGAPVPAPIAAPAVPTGVLIRRKSDGKKFKYPGSATEVPTDKYDILQ